VSKEQIEAQTFKDCFMNVLALYSALKGAPQRGVRRAELKQGEVIAEPIDFLADTEIKAKRSLGLLYYKVLLQLAAEDAYALFPIDLQCQLGQEFLSHDMNYDGHYRVLYFRAKNNKLHDDIATERPSFPEETVNAEDLLL
jgi:hypothetical protein